MLIFARLQLTSTTYVYIYSKFGFEHMYIFIQNSDLTSTTYVYIYSNPNFSLSVGVHKSEILE